jgi:predicted nucleic acid-binding Zn ribbon protein
VRVLAPRPLAGAIEQLTAKLAPATTLARVQSIWERATGAAVAAAARPTAERDGVLTVTCSSAAWAQELDLMGFELIGRLNAALEAEAIRELRCRSG